MTIAATCPQCEERIDAPDDGEPIRCPRCDCLFPLKRRDTYAEGIQAMPAPIVAAGPCEKAPTLEDQPPPRHGTPRSPFPVAPMLIVVIGILFFLLVFSVGFNIWFVMQPDRGIFNNAARAAEQQAIQQRMIAEQAAQQALMAQQEAQRQQAVQQAEMQALQRQLMEVRTELEVAKRKLEKANEPPNKGGVK
ncbi:MAG: hypothetical protein EXR98_14440 [Gemmataceae bacterium]|nr:hypothetical protein [Gemmataceae bacterium]